MQIVVKTDCVDVPERGIRVPVTFTRKKTVSGRERFAADIRFGDTDRAIIDHDSLDELESLVQRVVVARVSAPA